MLRYMFCLVIFMIISGCSHSSDLSSPHDINYYRHNFAEAQQRMSECQEKLKDDKSYAGKHQDCSDSFYVVVLDPSMESARRAH